MWNNVLETWPWLQCRCMRLVVEQFSCTVVQQCRNIMDLSSVLLDISQCTWSMTLVTVRVYASCYRTVQLYSCQTVLMDPGSQLCTTRYLAVHLEHDPGYITPCMLPLPYHGSVPRCPKEGLPSFLLSLISASCLWHQLPYWGKDLLGFILKVFGPLSINVDST